MASADMNVTITLSDEVKAYVEQRIADAKSQVEEDLRHLGALRDWASERISVEDFVQFRDVTEWVKHRIVELERQVEAAENRAGEQRQAARQAKEALAEVEAERDELRIQNVELREQIARLARPQP